MNPNTPPSSSSSNRRLILTAIIAVIVLGLAYSLYILISRAGKLPLTIYLAPKNAHLTINGKTSGGGTHYLTPGTYTLSASRDGFKANSRAVTVSNDRPAQVVLPLTPVTTDATKYVNSHKQDYLKTEQIGAQIVAEVGRANSAQPNIVNNLPYTDTYYQIGYLDNPDGSLLITVHTTSPRFRYAAIEQIRSWGFDPTTLDIDFVDYNNPLRS